MKTIEIEIFGEPVAKGRARTFYPKGRSKPVTTTPIKTRNWEERARWQAITQMSGQKLLEGALMVQINVVRSWPKSMSKKKKATAQATKRPDLDNYIKATLDFLKGIVWNDDAQIICLIAIKEYGDPPGVKIKITPIGDVA